MKVDGQLESATLEQLATNPATSTQGRVFDNTTTGKTMHDNGTDKRAILKNDSKLIVGNDPAEANNVRIHKAGTGVLQDVPGDNTTPEGTSSTTLAQRATRDENLTSGTLPAAGNIGRHAFLTDQKVLAEDDGTAWRRHIAEHAVDDSTAGSTITLNPITSSLVRLTGVFSTLNMIPAGFSAQRVVLVNRSGADVAVAHDNGATPANRIFTGTGANLVFKNNSSLTLSYDVTTQRWQVIGEAAGAASGGGGIPNAALITVTSDYTVLITDDAVFADVSNGPINLTLPSAVGNLGKEFLFKKIGSKAKNLLTILGTINGVVNEEVWALNSELRIISDGLDWKTVSAPPSEYFFQSPEPATYVNVAAMSTANVSLETMSEASLTTIDNIRPKAAMRVILKNQTVTEENGVYLLPAVDISIAATAIANENISTLANGSVVNVTVVSTGDKVSLRFQTNPQENGIYVIGATPGTTVRDTSQRDPSYLTAIALQDANFWCDFYNYPAASVALSATETSSSHTNNRQIFTQTSINATTFSGLTFTASSDVYTIKPPSNAKSVTYEVCPPGGTGAGGTNTRGGGSGSGAFPFVFSRPILPNSSIVLTFQRNFPPGTGATGSSGAVGFLSITQTGSGTQFNKTIIGGGSASGSGSGGTNSGALGPGTQLSGPTYLNGVANGSLGEASYFSNNASPGTGGSLGGGGGSAGAFGRGGTGGNGSLSAGFLGGAGDYPVTQSLSSVGYGYGGGGGGGGAAPASGRPGRGGFGGAGYIRLKWT